MHDSVQTDDSTQSERANHGLLSLGSRALNAAIVCSLGAALIGWVIFLVWAIKRLLG
jgi:hypothetical protein